jgi:hypothetical protein
MRVEDLPAVALRMRADAVAALEGDDELLYRRLEQAADEAYDKAAEYRLEFVRVPRLLSVVGSHSCETCEKEFWPQRTSARFCSEACKKVAMRRRAA